MRAETVRARQRRAGFLLVVALASIGCARVKPEVGPRLAFPFWTVTSASPRQVGCALLTAWISKTGKAGLGLSLSVTSPKGPCQVRLERARLFVGGREVADAAPPPPTTLGEKEVVRDYLPFFFDNNRAWNEHRRSGELLLAISAGGATQTLHYRLYQRNYPFFGPLAAPGSGPARNAPRKPSPKAGAQP